MSRSERLKHSLSVPPKRPQGSRAYRRVQGSPRSSTLYLWCPGAPEAEVEMAANLLLRAVVARDQQFGRRGPAVGAPPLALVVISFEGRRQVSTIGARVDVTLRCKVQGPLPHIAGKIELPPASSTHRRHAHRGEVYESGATENWIATPRAARIAATVYGVLVRCPRCHRPPREQSLLASARSRVFPLGFAWKKSNVPDAEGVRLVPVHAVDG